MRPYVGFKPIIPQKSAGCLTEPPVSLPKLAMHKPACTATALPPDEPPGTLVSSNAFKTFPYAEFSLVLPIANSSQLQLPIIMASSSNKRCTAVAEYMLANPSKIFDAAVTEWPL